MAMGQGAGLAAALAVKASVTPRAVDGKAIRAGLEARGVKFLGVPPA
jgi:hypothetical protein